MPAEKYICTLYRSYVQSVLNVYLCLGDCKRDFNPTHYRTPTLYSHLMTSAQWEGSEGREKQVYGFDIVVNKKVQTYIKVPSLYVYCCVGAIKEAILQ